MPLAASVAAKLTRAGISVGPRFAPSGTISLGAAVIVGRRGVGDPGRELGEMRLREASGEPAGEVTAGVHALAVGLQAEHPVDAVGRRLPRRVDLAGGLVESHQMLGVEGAEGGEVAAHKQRALVQHHPLHVSVAGVRPFQLARRQRVGAHVPAAAGVSLEQGARGRRKRLDRSAGMRRPRKQRTAGGGDGHQVGLALVVEERERSAHEQLVAGRRHRDHSHGIVGARHPVSS